MLRLFFFIVGFCWVATAHAQKLTVTYSEPNPEINRGKPVILYNEADNSVLHGGEVLGNGKNRKLDYWMNQYDPNSLNKTNSNTFSLEYAKGKNVIAVLSNMKIIIHETRGRNNEDKKDYKYISATVIAPNGSLNKVVLLGSFQLGITSDNYDYKFIEVDNHKSFLAYHCYQADEKNDQNFYIEYLAFDEKASKISEGKIKLNYTLDNRGFSVEVLDAKMDQEGNLCFVTSIGVSNVKNFNVQNLLTKQYLILEGTQLGKVYINLHSTICVSKDGKTKKEHFLLSQKYYYYKPMVTLDASGNWLITAIATGKTPEQNGVCYLKVNPKTLEKVDEKMHPFSKRVVRYEDTEKSGGMYLPSDLDIEYVMLGADGNNYIFVQGLTRVFIQKDRSILTESKADDIFLYDNVSTNNNKANDILVFALAPSGELLWDSRVACKGSNYLGFAHIMGKDDFFFDYKYFFPLLTDQGPAIIFPDHVDNLNKTDFVGLKEGDFLDMRKSHHVMVSFDAQGKWKKQDVMPAFTKEKGYPLIYDFKHMGNSVAIAVTKGSKSGEAFLVKMQVAK